MKVFLTGGTGFIGQAVVRALRGRGWEVTALIRDPRGAPARWMSARGVTLVQGDVTRRDGLREAMAGADAVLHNAGVYELGGGAAQRARMREVNVQGTDHVLGAALEAGVPRTVYVSTVWALGPSGYPPAPSVTRDEAHRHPGTFLTEYERSKVEAHEVALAWRRRGLPLVIAMPNAVVGPNDHSFLGYLLRLYLLRALPPMAWGADSVYAFVDVAALAEGIALAAERGRLGEDYLFCGEPIAIRALFAQWTRFPGGMRPWLWLPRGLMRLQLGLLEPLERAAGLPAFLSRDAVDVARAHLDYSAAKAQRELGWSHPGVDEMWERIIRRERELLAGRRGFRERLRHQEVVPDAATPATP